MGKELINGTERWCLWLKDSLPAERLASCFIHPRLKAVRALRLASPRAATQKRADTPHLFGEDRQPTDQYLAIPRVFSENRRWAT
jgi:hypothetical protein